MPTYSSGIIYDLIECLIPHLDNTGFANIPVYFLSPVADQTLAYSNILAEWLTANKQSRVYLPEEPFSHSVMVRNGRLKHYPGIHVDTFSNDYREPCIVFTGHPCLRFGDVVHFIELWGSSPRNMIIFTEPEFPYLEALAPYQPLQMKVALCPIDTSITFNQANKLLVELEPKHVLIPHQYSLPPRQLIHRTDLVVESGANEITFKLNETIKLPIKRRFERVDIDADLSVMMLPNEVRPGVSVATITGNLQAKDNKLRLEALTKPQVQELNNWSPGRQPMPPSNYAWGPLDLQLFMSKLNKAGMFDASVEQTQSGCIVHIVRTFRLKDSIDRLLKATRKLRLGP